MRVLVTGHTGFKGSWLSLALASSGHEVHGIALDPEPMALFERAQIGDALASDRRVDIRSADELMRAVRSIDPDFAFHLAAQPLVRRSYAEPRLTVETNILGTYNVIEALADSNCQAAVVVTTDKVYRNLGQREGYRESDPLGGHDPYSASKAAADLLTQSWAASFPGVRLAIARAGNVIGGGDVSADRLMPDLVRAFTAGSPAEIRQPSAIRPWQHVLDCIAGYLKLADALVDGSGEGAWNFGPVPMSFRTVAEAADEAARCWGDGANWIEVSQPGAPHEAQTLTLDASRARRELDWTDSLSFGEAIAWTIEWSKEVNAGADPAQVTREQLKRHEALRGAR